MFGDVGRQSRVISSLLISLPLKVQGPRDEAETVDEGSESVRRDVLNARRRSSGMTFDKIFYDDPW